MRTAVHFIALPLLAVVALAQSPSSGAQQTTSAKSNPPAKAVHSRSSQAAKDAPSAAEQDRQQRAQMAQDMLELSHSIAAVLPPDQRAKVLPRQINAAGFMNPQLAAQWAEEALAFGRQVSPG